jgi:serine O-acetyltransferase
VFGPDFFNRQILRLARCQNRGGIVGEAAHFLLKLHGTDIHPRTQIPPDLHLRHTAVGVVIHPATRFGSDVTVFHGVTVARADSWLPEDGPFGGFEIRDHAILGAGCILLNKGREPLVVGEGSVIGAGAVLTRSTGPWEIWAGNPARQVSRRDGRG